MLYQFRIRILGYPMIPFTSLLLFYSDTLRRFRDLTVPSYLLISYDLKEPDTHFATIYHTNSPILFSYFAYFAYRLPHHLLLLFYKLLPPFVRVVQVLRTFN